SPESMAPEGISGAPPSFASDIYAVGIILYELLAYKTPFFAGSTTEILANHLRAIHVSLSTKREQVPKELDAIVSKALAKHPADRFASAAEMREALLGISVQLRSAPVTDKWRTCGQSGEPRFKFRPGWGMPRHRITRPVDIQIEQQPTVLPLPFSGRRDELAALLKHLRRAPAKSTADNNVGLLVM